MTRYYLYKFSDGSLNYLTPDQANQYVDNKLGVRVTHDGHNRSINSPVRRTKDSFKEGYDPGLGEYVRSKGHRKELVKRKGLIDTEGVRLPPKTTKERKSYFSDQDIRDFKASNIPISDSEARELTN